MLDRSLIFNNYGRTTTRTVYILKLKGGYYYVGWSRKYKERIEQHRVGKGSAWTKLHPVEEVVDILEGNEALENAKTLEFMARFGLDIGGKWVEIELSDPPLALLASHNGKCFKCGKKGHMISNCPLESSDHLKQNLTLPLASYCLRCGRDGHSIRSCFAFTDLNGEFLEDIPCCYRCGYSNHTKRCCYAKYDKWGQKI